MNQFFRLIILYKHHPHRTNLFCTSFFLFLIFIHLLISICCFIFVLCFIFYFIAGSPLPPPPLRVTFLAKLHNDNDRSTVAIEQQHALKELKLVHRNQTIITGSSSDYDHDQEVPFDFSNGTVTDDGDCDRGKSIEPMELEHRGKADDKDDVEMETVELIDQRSPTLVTTVAAAVAIRPTTLNIPGPALTKTTPNTHSIQAIQSMLLLFL